MSYIPTPEQALELVKKYNSEPFHIQHAETVSKVLGYFAGKHDPDRIDYWRTVGMLHDIDFELYPEQHCVKAVELLHDNDVDDGVIRSVVSHGYGLCSDVKPEEYMEKVLFAVDELAGLIGAAALMRPTGMEGLGVKSVMKKFKSKGFAAGCSRDVIQQGADMLGVDLPELIEQTLEAMNS
ncbi:MAG TPA: hydrolase [Firmicutes bacterium]|nr:hydrolase [Bacillota bacterium]